MKKSILFLLMLPFLYACGGEKAESNLIETLNIAEAIEGNTVEVALSKYATSIRYIPLQSTPESMVAGVEHLQSDGERYYVGSMRQPQVKCFAADGSFIGVLGSQGRGPAEYMRVGGLVLEKEGNVANIGVRALNKIAVYNSEGKFVRNVEGIGVSGRKRANDAEFIGEGKYAAIAVESDTTGKTFEAITITDTLGAVISKERLGEQYTKKNILSFGGQERTVDIGMPTQLYTINGEIAIVKGALDTIYTYDKESRLKAKYLIDFGQYAPLVYETPQVSKQIDIRAKDIFETNDFLLVKMGVPVELLPNLVGDGEQRVKKEITLLYDKKSETLALLSDATNPKISGFVNDLDNGDSFVPDIIQDGKMYQVVDAPTFIEMALQSNSTEAKQAAAQLTQESNPVIIEVTLSNE